MKQKEKWAEKYVWGPDSEIADTFMAHERSWIAGFEFAKEKLTETTNPDISAKDIRNLGENEI